MMQAHINIGSNIGNRRALIERAVAAIEAIEGRQACRSDFIETEPWGFCSPNPFLNLGIAIDTALDPAVLLHKLLEIESSINSSPHRREDGTYADRQLDIDLIAVDSLVIDTPELTLPHPRMHLRAFVLRPMAQTAPGWVHPRLGKTAQELLHSLGDTADPDSHAQ